MKILINYLECRFYFIENLNSFFVDNNDEEFYFQTDFLFSSTNFSKCYIEIGIIIIWKTLNTVIVLSKKAVVKMNSLFLSSSCFILCQQ